MPPGARTGHAESVTGSRWQLISPPDCEQRPVLCTRHNTYVGKLTGFFTSSPVQGMPAIPVMFLIKELDDFIICVKPRRLILAGNQLNLRLIHTVRLNSDARMLADKTAHRRRTAPNFTEDMQVGY